MKKIASIIISGIILWILYSKINVSAAFAILSQANKALLVVSLLLIIPVLILNAVRLQWIMPKHKRLHFIEMQRLIFLANTLNMILPAKLGDISKAFFLRKKYNLKSNLSFAVILAEKVGDMLGLSVICLLGLLIHGPIKGPYLHYLTFISILTAIGFIGLLSRKLTHFCFKLISIPLPKKLLKKLIPFFLSWTGMQKYLSKQPKKLFQLLAMSFASSFIHFFGIWIMFLSIYPQLPLSLNLALTPFSVLAGLIPITFSGIGTRDVALVGLFEGYVSPEIAAAFGLLFTIRLIFFAMPGLPYLSYYFPNKAASIIKRTSIKKGT